MIAVYDSLTGNVRRFVEKLQMPSIRVQEDLEVNEAFILITYTAGLGFVPEGTEKFLEKNHLYLRGVSASGNRYFGEFFAISADKISEKYGVPIISKFELSGTNKDVAKFMEGVEAVEIRRIK